MLELGGALANLAYASGGRVNLFGRDGLYRVDDKDIGLHGIDMLKDALRDGFADHIALVGVDTDAVGSHFDLLFALLTADIQQFAVVYGEGRLEEQCALPDARLATQKQEAAGNDAASEHTVELGTMGRNALRLAIGYLLNSSRG